MLINISQSLLSLSVPSFIKSIISCFEFALNFHETLAQQVSLQCNAFRKPSVGNRGHRNLSQFFFRNSFKPGLGQMCLAYCQRIWRLLSAFPVHSSSFIFWVSSTLKCSVTSTMNHIFSYLYGFCFDLRCPSELTGVTHQ